MFITFEGIEGSGKTTQAKNLVNSLNQNGFKAIFTREPGGTPLAEKIRELILTGDGISCSLTEFLLLIAARNDHVTNFIIPYLEKGYIVVCDRFYDSTIVYQGYVKGLELNTILKIHESVFGAFKPDKTFLIDVDPAIAAQRIDGTRKNNHYDHKPIDFHTNIRTSYLKCAEQDSERFFIIDGNEPLDEISNDIINKFNKLYINNS